MRESLMMGVTFLYVMIGWVIFRADNLSHACHYIKLMFTDFNGFDYSGSRLTILWIIILIAIEWFTRDRECPFEPCAGSVMQSRAVRWTLYYIVFMAVLFLGGQTQTFIYFQF